MRPGSAPPPSELAAKRQALGDAIRQLRVSRRLTQRDLAEHAEISRTTLVAIERGLQATTVDQLYQLAGVLDVAVTVFFPIELHLFDPYNPRTEARGKLTEAESKRRSRR